MSKIILNDVRLAFPSLWETEKYNGQDTGKYAATFLISKDDPQVDTIKAAILAMAEEKFGKPVPKSVKFCLQDGDEKEFNGANGHWTIKATTKNRPVVMDQDKNPLVEADGKIYGGAYVNTSISLWAMDNQYGKRILANLAGVQLVRDGESFGGGSSNAMDDFSVITTTKPTVDVEDPFA
jgi:hypothetical protein